MNATNLLNKISKSFNIQIFFKLVVYVAIDYSK